LDESTAGDNMMCVRYKDIYRTVLLPTHTHTHTQFDGDSRLFVGVGGGDDDDDNDDDDTVAFHSTID